jgi:diacylglycerol kinase family enzyme
MPLPSPILFLINPIAGGGQGGSIAREIPDVAKSIGLTPEQYSVVCTERDSNLSDLIPSGTKTVLVVGGDGAVAGAVQGVMHRPEKPSFGIIPLGTANDLARYYGSYPIFRRQGWAALLPQLLNAATRPHDFWVLNQSVVMLNYCSVGFDARITCRFNRLRGSGRRRFRRSLLNKMVYEFYGFSNIAYGIRDSHHLSRTKEDTIAEHVMTRHRGLIISNIPSYAAGARPAPGADAHDGILNLTPVGGFWEFIGVMLSRFPSLRANPLNFRMPQWTASRLEMALSPDNFLQVDGEDQQHLVSGGKVTIEHGGQVRMLTLGPVVEPMY